MILIRLHGLLQEVLVLNRRRILRHQRYVNGNADYFGKSWSVQTKMLDDTNMLLLLIVIIGYS